MPQSVALSEALLKAVLEEKQVRTKALNGTVGRGSAAAAIRWQRANVVSQDVFRYDDPLERYTITGAQMEK